MKSPLSALIRQREEEFKQSELFQRLQAEGTMAVLHGMPQWYGETVLSFHRQSLIALIEKQVEMVRGMKKTFCRCLCEKTKLAMSFNAALDQIIAFLEDTLKELR